MKPVFWIIKNDRFNSVLCDDNKFRNLAAVERFKVYKREGNAAIKLCGLGDGHTAFALYAGDVLDCCGRITRKANNDYV